MLCDGVMLRRLPHGTIIMWDQHRERAFPYYGNDVQFEGGRVCKFETDETDTVVSRIIVRQLPRISR